MVLLGRINRFALNRIARPKRHCNTFFCNGAFFHWAFWAFILQAAIQLKSWLPKAPNAWGDNAGDKEADRQSRLFG